MEISLYAKAENNCVLYVRVSSTESRKNINIAYTELINA
jgi:hypothetical protein